MGYRPDILKYVRQLNIIDDILFQKMSEDKDFCSELISTILQKNVTVVQTIPQNSIKNLQGRSVILDALCITDDKKQINVEVQKANNDDHFRRIRYNSSCITANTTDPGVKFQDIPDIYMIFISKFDIFGAGKTVYHIDRIIRETGRLNHNGLTEIYVNTQINDGSDLAELMRLFVQSNAYNFKKFPKCSERKKQFKMTKKGESEVCDLVEEYVQIRIDEATKEANEAAKEANEAAKEAAKQTMIQAIIKMIKRGYSTEEIIEIYPEMSMDMILKLRADVEQ